MVLLDTDHTTAPHASSIISDSWSLLYHANDHVITRLVSRRGVDISICVVSDHHVEDASSGRIDDASLPISSPILVQLTTHAASS